jgi:hypothetical protein
MFLMLEKNSAAMRAFVLRSQRFQRRIMWSSGLSIIGTLRFATTLYTRIPTNFSQKATGTKFLSHRRTQAANRQYHHLGRRHQAVGKQQGHRLKWHNLQNASSSCIFVAFHTGAYARPVAVTGPSKPTICFN